MFIYPRIQTLLQHHAACIIIICQVDNTNSGLEPVNLLKIVTFISRWLSISLRTFSLSLLDYLLHSKLSTSSLSFCPATTSLQRCQTLEWYTAVKLSESTSLCAANHCGSFRIKRRTQPQNLKLFHCL